MGFLILSRDTLYNNKLLYWQLVLVTSLEKYLMQKLSIYIETLIINYQQNYILCTCVMLKIRLYWSSGVGIKATTGLLNLAVASGQKRSRNRWLRLPFIVSDSTSNTGAYAKSKHLIHQRRMFVRRSERALFSYMCLYIV